MRGEKVGYYLTCCNIVIYGEKAVPPLFRMYRFDINTFSSQHKDVVINK